MVHMDDVGPVPRRREVPGREVLRAERPEGEDPGHARLLPMPPVAGPCALHRHDLDLVPQCRGAFREVLDDALPAAGTRPVVTGEVKNAHTTIYNRTSQENPSAFDVTGITAIFQSVRAVIVSHVYANPASRGKLHALVGQGAAVAVAVPARWTPPGSSESIETPFAEDNGVRIVPIPTSGREPGGAPTAWRAGALRRLLTDFRPDVVQIEEEPTTRVAAGVTRLARPAQDSGARLQRRQPASHLPAPASAPAWSNAHARPRG